MRPVPFDYRAPDTLEEVLEVLEETPDATSLLAGGQSLVPMLNMRLARPDLVLDLRWIGALVGVSRVDGMLRIGAMTRQRAIEIDGAVVTGLPLLPAALRHVAHVAVRTRGTIGGSLAHADPAAELPAAVAALDGRIRLRSLRASRVVTAEGFFVGSLLTSIEPGEVLEGVDLPIPPPRTGWGFREVAATHGAFALVGAAALVRLAADRTVEHARLALMGVDSTPVVVDWLSEVMVARPCDAELLGEVRTRLHHSLDPPDDVEASASYRRKAGAAIAVRALHDAAHRARGDAP
jgi:aerobic carbon-monoxide dehydrogenase medium subunit